MILILPTNNAGVNGPYSGFVSFFFCSSAISGDYGTTSQAFIFSLNNNEGLAPLKAMVNDASKAIFRNSLYGITFGAGNDLYIADAGSYARFGTSFSVPPGVQDTNTILAGTLYFTPDEVEMFYLGA